MWYLNFKFSFSQFFCNGLGTSSYLTLMPRQLSDDLDIAIEESLFQYCGGAIVFGQFQRASRKWPMFLSCFSSFTLLLFYCYLYMADGCIGGGRQMSASGSFLSECFTKFFCRVRLFE